MRTPDSDQTRHQDTSAEPKKPYEAPRIVFREPMEVVAGFCGPPQGKADAILCAILST